jgi:hypothetical protein
MEGEAMADESPKVWHVKGKDYPIPTEFDIGELWDMERYFGVVFGEETPPSGVAYIASLLYIALRRDDPTITVDDIRALPSDVFVEMAEVDARPPDSEPESETSPDPSGSDSNTDSDAQANGQSPTGIQGSHTGSTSDLLTSAPSRRGN